MKAIVCARLVTTSRIFKTNFLSIMELHFENLMHTIIQIPDALILSFIEEYYNWFNMQGKHHLIFIKL